MAYNPWSLFSPWSQTVEPVTNWQRFFNPQVVFNYNPEDERVESHVLTRVGSYGSQISTLIDAINVLQSRIDRTSLKSGERDALEAFDGLRDRAAQAVDEFRGRISPDEILSAVSALRERDPKAAEALCAKIAALPR